MRAFAVTCVLLSFSAQSDAQEFTTDKYHVTAGILREEFGVDLGIAAPGAARELSNIALELVKHFEGWAEVRQDPSLAYAYNDPSAYCTIGYGHLIDLAPCTGANTTEFVNGLNLQDGQLILLSDTFLARKVVADAVAVDLTDDQFGALASFVFNVGGSNFRKSTLLKLVNAGDFQLASDQFGRWVKSKGRILPGLVARRSCEESLFRGDLSLASDGRFDRSFCKSLGVAPEAGPLIDVETGE